MTNRHLPPIHRLLKPLLATILIFSLLLSVSPSALAARTGGRMGGGNFRPRTYQVAPRSSHNGGYYPTPRGGGIGFPFLIPFLFSGGGLTGLLSLFVLLAVANSLLQTWRNRPTDQESSPNPEVVVSRLQVGLLAQARELQADLENLGQQVDTSTPTGLAKLLQESSLALLRHPECWVYAGSTSQKLRLDSAEAQFNRYSLAERSKYSQEAFIAAGRSPGLMPIPRNDQGGYIVVSILVASRGRSSLPEVRDSAGLQAALTQLGGGAATDLLAVEVIWTPQAPGDVLSADDLLVGYPDLKLI